ncbi:murein hydrolase activator EnvC family protein [Bacillus massilinigeriensis]|uniref:murein hydrolase activator EnvC family protein n=1 Tax=Bacillus massilionigeriensis TaxID=1805475 RepID=UPI00096B1DDC|nr:peptidoglycan DD-metalloendopeptidase family protein [Bacillus massilionigeriensis]
MKKSILTLSVIASLTLGTLAAGVPNVEKAYASKSDEINTIKNKRSDLNSKIGNKNNEIEKLQGQQNDVKEELTQINITIQDTQNKIVEKKEQIQDTKTEIKKLEKEIAELTKRINKRNELLKERARSFQENGGTVSYLDVLMGAQSFSDFIDRVSAVATIVEADQDILREQKADKELLEKKQKQVEDKLADLEKKHAELQQMKSSLDAKKAEKDQLMSALKEKEEEAHAEMLSLEEEERILAAQQSALQKALELERQRQSSSYNNNGNTGSAPPVSSGTFTRPVAGMITSGLGMRWGSYHAGIDIAQGGTNPIVAAADGVVIQSYRSSSYGEVVFISHNIDGQVYTTVYAHMRSGSRAVSSGQVVKKGQRIGTMGSTGDSTGQHLHFELHRGPWTQSKSNAIDPRSVVPF